MLELVWNLAKRRGLRSSTGQNEADWIAIRILVAERTREGDSPVQPLSGREVHIRAGHGCPGAEHHVGKIYLRMEKSKHVAKFVHGQALMQTLRQR